MIISFPPVIFTLLDFLGGLLQQQAQHFVVQHATMMAIIIIHPAIPPTIAPMSTGVSNPSELEDLNTGAAPSKSEKQLRSVIYNRTVPFLKEAFLNNASEHLFYHCFRKTLHLKLQY